MAKNGLKAVEGESAAPQPPLGLLQKIHELQKRIETFAKDAKNPHFQYGFASAKGVNEKIRPVLLDLGLVMQTHTNLEEVTAAGLVVATTVVRLIDIETGDGMDFSSIGSGIDKGDKGAMKAATASQKYATIAMVFGATGDDPEADIRTDVPSVPATRPASTRTNRPAEPTRRAPVAGEAPITQSTSKNAPIRLDDGFVVTVDVDKVYDGQPSKTKPGKFGPGTVVDPGGTRYDTFDKGLLGLARRAKDEQKQVTIMYTFNEQFGKNVIADGGLTIFGEEPQEEIPGEEPAEY